MCQEISPSLFYSKLHSAAILNVLYALPVLTIKLILLISHEMTAKTGFPLNIVTISILKSSVLTSGLIQTTLWFGLFLFFEYLWFFIQYKNEDLFRIEKPTIKHVKDCTFLPLFK